MQHHSNLSASLPLSVTQSLCLRTVSLSLLIRSWLLRLGSLGLVNADYDFVQTERKLKVRKPTIW